MSRRYGYARVSTADQSLDIQRDALKTAGCDKILEEKASGASREGRGQLRVLLDFVGEGDAIIVTKLDRLARSTIDMLEIVRDISGRGAGFKSLAEPWCDTTSPAGKLMLTVFAGVAQFERERIKERQREGIDKAKSEGRYKGGKRRFDPDEIRALRDQGLGPTEIKDRIGAKSTMTVYRALESAAP